MKYLALSLFALLYSVIFLSSCNKDDDNTSPSAIVGTWKVISQTYSDCDDPSDNGNETYTCTDLDCYTFTFEANKNFQLVIKVDGMNFLDFSGTYSISGSTLKICLFLDCQNMTYSIDGDTLVISGTDEDGCYSETILVR